ncbi:hypothetical protein GCM10011491_41220 [Brucella endophytica]|uniref:Uncharacterized protein n=1 Tax=Brucella endophytica TaxID=1963359 RepID=A0A916SP15_9HYPH|nr:hypothetical protein GCM10011491_41220 [Brucella endophytica]
MPADYPFVIGRKNDLVEHVKKNAVTATEPDDGDIFLDARCRVQLDDKGTLVRRSAAK